MTEKRKKIILVLLILAAVAGLMITLTVWSFGEYEFVRKLFAGETASPAIGKVAPDDPAGLVAKQLFAGRVSAVIYAVIITMQIAAFILAVFVLNSIKSAQSSSQTKLKEVDNADIFFDVPLYIGLFGTVSSFLVMSISPQSSKLIAYSSTLVGIIFSVVLRVILLYPFRRMLLTEEPSVGEKAAEK